ncbi:hypothetical protein GCM10007860_20610 [Chitiniphilus shinanonensis]|uniref:Lipoprotein n=1 Tax=Chitiniphilus shinanonensis TaxID=553088 RepID=A0ABQ6BSE0_9NEIS|nr:hypothetical protein [Chitiniphilus shinanonensis]GLS04913.1 hypothetical protein GCM10007860_20610 [Chitiniphilus shinanonensis]
MIKRNRNLASWSSALFVAAGLSACATASAQSEAPGMIVKFRDDSKRESLLAQLAKRYRVELGAGRPLALGSWVYPVSGDGRDAFVAALLRTPEVEYAEWDGRVAR